MRNLARMLVIPFIGLALMFAGVTAANASTTGHHDGCYQQCQQDQQGYGQQGYQPGDCYQQQGYGQQGYGNGDLQPWGNPCQQQLRYKLVVVHKQVCKLVKVVFYDRKHCRHVIFKPVCKCITFIIRVPCFPQRDYQQMGYMRS